MPAAAREDMVGVAAAAAVGLGMVVGGGAMAAEEAGGAVAAAEAEAGMAAGTGATAGPGV